MPHITAHSPNTPTTRYPGVIVDMHLDMAYNAIVLGRNLRQPLSDLRTHEQTAPPPSTMAGKALVSLPELLKGHIGIVGASLFVAPAYKTWSQDPLVYHTPEQAHTQAVAQLDYYRHLSDSHAQINILHTTAELEATLVSWDSPNPHIGLFLVMEGAEPIHEPGELEWWVERGLRGIGLTWSSGTRYAGGCSMPGGLSDMGHDLLNRMADYNLMLDVSHMWPDAVYESLDLYPGPLVATHANPRAFVDSARSLSDDLIRRIAERNGVIGIIPYNPMLKQGWRVGEARLPLTRLIEAIDHICQCAGHAQCVGIGSDSDGGFGLESIPEPLTSIADLGMIGALLNERGYSPADIEAILRTNWLRVLRQVLST